MAKKKETNPTGVPEDQTKAQSADHINTQVDGLKITLPAVSGKGKGESSIMKDFRRSDWLYNPVVYTQISGDFTLMQQRVFIGVVEKLQDRILDSITEQKRTKQWPMLFSPAEMNENIDLRIDARSLGVPPERYPELKQALEQLMGMKFGYVKHRGKTTTYEMGVLFHYISMDVPDDLVKRNGEYVPRTRSTGKIRIKMDKDNVNNFLSMAGGYTMHIARIAQICKKKRTPRIYIFLSFYRDYEQGKAFDYKEFCAFLGIDDDSYVANCIERLSKQLKNEEITKAEFAEQRAAIKETDNPFHKYNKVRSLVGGLHLHLRTHLRQQPQEGQPRPHPVPYREGKDGSRPRPGREDVQSAAGFDDEALRALWRPHRLRPHAHRPQSANAVVRGVSRLLLQGTACPLREGSPRPSRRLRADRSAQLARHPREGRQGPGGQGA